MAEMNTHFSMITLNINGFNFLNQRAYMISPSSFCTIAVVHMRVLSHALKSIHGCEERSEYQNLNRRCYRVNMQFPTVMMTLGYIGESKITDDHCTGEITINLTGKMNMCGMTSPIFHVQPRHLDSGKIICFHPIGFHCAGELSWYHGPQRSKIKKTQRRGNPGICFFLEVKQL